MTRIHSRFRLLRESTRLGLAYQPAVQVRERENGDSQPISARTDAGNKAVGRTEIGGSPPFSPERTSASGCYLAAWLLLLTPALHAIPKTIIFSPDITIVLDGQTIDDENAAEDDLNGNLTPVDTGALPANADLQAYHRTGDVAVGDLLVLDTAVDLAGGVHSTPRKVIGLNAGVFSEFMNLAACGVPDGVQIDAMTSGAAMWFSFDVPVTLGGQLYDDEDVVALSDGCVWQAVLDGSAAGVAAGLDIDGIHFQEDENLLLISFDAAGTVGGVSFDDEDVLGYSLNPGGGWGMVYDGSAEHPGAEWNPADLDALGTTPEVVIDPDPDPDDPDPDSEPEPKGPRLRVRPQRLEFELSQDDAPASKPFTVQAIDGEIQYTVRRGASWLSANPTRGVSDGELDTILAIVDPRGLAPGVYQRPLFIQGSGQRRLLIVSLTVTPGAPPPPVGPSTPENSAVNAASMIPFGLPGHPMSPQSVVAVFGSRFAEGEHIAETIPLPFQLGGVSVTFNNISAGMFHASPGQLLVQLPGSLLDGVAASQTGGPAVQGTATMVITNAAGSSEPRVVQLDTYSPAVYTLNQTGSGQGVVLFSNTSDLAGPAGSAANSRPAAAGDLLTIYANGLGPVVPPIEDLLNSCDPDGQCLPDFSNIVLRTTATKPVVTVGGVGVPDEDVLFPGLSPLFVSLNEVVFRLPGGVPAGDAVPIVLELGGVASRGDVTIAVE